mmetsp:Transcript_140363/g.356171  ORF Transcript_140363/g.356171 Transcript_140363/m.356171 type:complete len:265 (-) Transcript_140363:21-815(-)
MSEQEEREEDEWREAERCLQQGLNTFRPSNLSSGRAPKCQNDHELLISLCLIGAQICDGCRRRIQATYTHRCKACDYDLCSRCFRSKSRATSAQSAPHRAPKRPAGIAAPPSIRGRRRHHQMRNVYGLGLPIDAPELAPLPPLVPAGAARAAAASGEGGPSGEGDAEDGPPSALPSAARGGARGAPFPASARGPRSSGRPTTAPGELHPPQGLPADEQCRVATAMLVAHYMSIPTGHGVRNPKLRPGTCAADYPSRAIYSRSVW